MKRQKTVLISLFLLCASLFIAYHPARAATWNVSFEVSGTAGLRFIYSCDVGTGDAYAPKTLTESENGFTLIATGAFCMYPGYSGTLTVVLYVDGILRDSGSTSDPYAHVTVQYSDYSAVYSVIFIPMGIVIAILVTILLVYHYRKARSPAVKIPQQPQLQSPQQQQQQQVITVNIPQVSQPIALFPLPPKQFCVFCGKELPQDAIYCEYCGRRQNWK
jgi:hypothetical protein